MDWFLSTFPGTSLGKSIPHFLWRPTPLPFQVWLLTGLANQNIAPLATRINSHMIQVNLRIKLRKFSGSIWKIITLSSLALLAC